MASSFRTNNLIVSGTMSGNGNITEIDTSSTQGNAGNANYWIKVAECISDADDKAQATIYVSLEGKAGDVRCGGIVYLRHGGSTGYYDISVDLINPPNSPNTQDNTDFVLTYDSSVTYKSQLWVRSNETFQKCYATIIDGTRQPNENYVNFYELTPGSTWVSSITSLGADLTATYTNRTFNDLSISSVTSILDLKDGLIVTGNIYVKNDSNDGFNIGTENTFMLSAQGSIRMVVDNDNDTANGYFSVEGPSNAYNFVSYDDGKNYLNFSKNALGDFWYRGGNSESLLHIDAGENSVAIGASELFPFSSSGIGQDVLIYLSGSKDTKDSSTRGVALIAGDGAISGSLTMHGGVNGKLIFSPTGQNDQYIYGSGDALYIEGDDSIFMYTDTNGYFKVYNGVSELITKDLSGNLIINDSSNNSDFRVESNNLPAAILVDGGDDTIILGASLNTFAAQPSEAKGNDVRILLSGSAGSKDSATRGVTLVAGDMVVSGTIYNGSGVAITGDITEITAGTGLTGGGVSGNVTLSTNDAAIVHDNLSGFVSNEHIDHSTVSISGNNGIAGGGDLTSSRTLSLDFSSLTDMTGDISATTEFILQDGSTESRKAASEIKLSNFNNDSGWTTNTGTVTSVGLLAGNLIDISGGPITTSGNITVDVDLSELTTSTSDGDGDFFVVVNSANDQRKLTKANINLSGFNNDLVINANDVDWTDGGNKLLTTSSVSIDSDGNYVNSYGSDIYFYVSGSNDAGLTSPITGKNFNGVAAFGGDVVLSGSLYLEPYDSSGFTVSRSLIFGSKNTKINSVVTPDNLTDLDIHSIGLMRLGNLNDEATGPGNADVNVFISGSIGSKNSSNRGTLLVGGDLVISGSLYGNTVIERVFFQNPILSGSGSYFPPDDSTAEGANNNINFHISESKIIIDKVKIRFNAFTNGPSGDITISLHKGNDGDNTVSGTSSTSVTLNQSFTVDTIYSFIFPDDGNNIVNEDQLWTMNIKSTTLLMGATNLHALIYYRRI